MTPDLPKLRTIIKALRAPLPARFRWDMTDYYSHTDCRTAGCALGLGVEIGVVGPEFMDIIFGENGNDLGLSADQAVRLFCPDAWVLRMEGLPDRLRDITPKMQADRMERFVRRCESARRGADTRAAS